MFPLPLPPRRFIQRGIPATLGTFQRAATQIVTAISTLVVQDSLLSLMDFLALGIHDNCQHNRQQNGGNSAKRRENQSNQNPRPKAGAKNGDRLQKLVVALQVGKGGEGAEPGHGGVCYTAHCPLTIAEIMQCWAS